MFKTCFTHIIIVAMATYFPPNFVKNDNFSNQGHFFNIIFKVRNKENIRNVQKRFYTYHGCHGNIFFPKCL